MSINWKYRIGEWNPQFLREIKGRLNIRNVVLSVAVSLVAQLMVWMPFINQIPGENYPLRAKYCRLPLEMKPLLARQELLYKQLYSFPQENDSAKTKILHEKIDRINAVLPQNCPQSSINMELWWQDHWLQIFLWLSAIGFISLLVLGTYMLIADLAKEESRGTLNFIRLSPQSTYNIFIGKLLGVPILLYLGVFTAIPFHLWSGFRADINIGAILVFYGLVVACCTLFYSLALLFALVSPGLRGFQPWLCSGTMLFLSIFTPFHDTDYTPLVWLNFFHPGIILPYLVNLDDINYSFIWRYNLLNDGITNAQFFYLPFGQSEISVVAFAFLNYGLWTYLIWQVLNHCFRNPNGTILPKAKSYQMMLCFQLFSLGFTLQSRQNTYGLTDEGFYWVQMGGNFLIIAFFNAIAFLILMGILSPGRQALQDWDRYRKEKISRSQISRYLAVVSDLIWNDKSPSILAIAIHLAIATIPILIFILLAPSPLLNENFTGESKLGVILGVAFFATLTLIYTTITQLLLLMKTAKPTLWAAGALASLIFLPPISLLFLGIFPYDKSLIWLFSTFPWAGIPNSSITTILQTLLGHLVVLASLNLLSIRQLRIAGESATKSFLAGRSV